MMLDQNITGSFICSRSFESVARHLMKIHKNADEDVEVDAEERQVRAHRAQTNLELVRVLGALLKCDALASCVGVPHADVFQTKQQALVLTIAKYASTACVFLGFSWPLHS